MCPHFRTRPLPELARSENNCLLATRAPKGLTVILFGD
ncbi:unnamed protein product [Arabidopsis halleri]